jgi:NAD(P)H-quinone oxidoreductase subunit 5
MPELEQLLTLLGYVVLAAPAILLAILGLSSLAAAPLPERIVHRVIQVTMVVGLIAACGVLGLMLLSDKRHVVVNLGDWVHLHEFHFSLKFVFDRLSVPFVILTFLLCGTIGAFANRYLHREPGFNRFFVFYALFVLGMVMTSLAGTIESLFFGWELVGVSSALLVAFFQERTAPVRNGLRVWTVYRISDAALLLAAVVLHHLTGQGDFDKLMGQGAPWPYGHAGITYQQALIVGGLLVVAAAGKSALIPFSGWLPRAMEGPTPSSAVFYGALSVHLGAYLLLRVSPILDLSPVLSGTIFVLGLGTAAYSALTARVQTDIKCALSFASLTQVGIIVAEIGLSPLGPPWVRYFILVHILGHAFLRTLQFLRAPSLLNDYRNMENAIGGRLSHAPQGGGRWLPTGVRAWLYRFGQHRGYLDAFLSDYVARPILRILSTCDAMERRWTDFLSGGTSRESDAIGPSAGSLEDLS